MSKYASYILYMLLSVLVVILFLNDFGPLSSLQRSLNDTLLSFNAPSGVRPNIVMVNIDGPAMDEYGQWPWNRDLIADLLAATAHGEPKAIVTSFDLSEDAAQDSAGYTGILASQLEWIDNIVLPYDIAIATFRNNKTNNPEYLFDYSLSVDNPLGLMPEDASLQVRKVFLPADKILASEPKLGFEYLMPAEDRVLRYQPLVMNYEGYYYPSVSLMAASMFLDVPPDQVRVIEGKEIRIGNSRTIPINDKSEMLLSFAEGDPFVSYSAAEILGEGFNFESLKGKIVLVNANDPNLLEEYQTPLGDAKTRPIVKATTIENIVNDNLLKIADDQLLLGIIILFLLGGICAAALPSMSTMYRFVALIIGFILLANVN